MVKLDIRTIVRYTDNRRHYADTVSKDARFAQKQPSTSKKLTPIKLSGEIIDEGNLSHSHQFEITQWDHRLGPDVVNLDVARDDELEFPMATFKDLWVCPCGCKVVTSNRSLI